MRAVDIYNKSLALLGYNDCQSFRNNALMVLNAIYSDIWYCEGKEDNFNGIEVLSDEINLQARSLNDIMPYGVAALLAQMESDGEKQQMYMRIYNQKRAALSRAEDIKDKLPLVEG